MSESTEATRHAFDAGPVDTGICQHRISGEVCGGKWDNSIHLSDDIVNDRAVPLEPSQAAKTAAREIAVVLFAKIFNPMSKGGISIEMEAQFATIIQRAIEPLEARIRELVNTNLDALSGEAELEAKTQELINSLIAELAEKERENNGLRLVVSQSLSSLMGEL